MRYKFFFNIIPTTIKFSVALAAQFIAYVHFSIRLRHIRLFSRLSSLVSLIVFPLAVLGWNGVVHRVIAEIAWQNLSTVSKQQCGCLLRVFHHNWSRVRTFEQLSVWPDEIKGEGIEAFNAWHFINRPLYADQTHWQSNMTQSNSVWAIQQAMTVLTAPHPNRSMQALFLAFLVHMTGDLHQPLHTATRVSRAHPEGDYGGNDFKIRGGRGQTNNLHQLWDQALGVIPRRHVHSKQIKQFAKKLEDRYPKRFFGERLGIRDPAVWASESFRFAKAYAYALPENSQPSKAYLKKSRILACEQIVLAGYRLANMLNWMTKTQKWCGEDMK